MKPKGRVKLDISKENDIRLQYLKRRMPEYEEGKPISYNMLISWMLDRLE